MIKLKRTETPRRYTLSWRSSSEGDNPKRGPAIVVSIHPSTVNELPELSPDTHKVSTTIDNFNFRSFTGDITSNFGFEEAIVKNKQDNGAIELIGELPDDKGKDAFARTTAETFWPLAASITLLLQTLNYTDAESDGLHNQLMKVEASFTRDSDGRLICSVGGVYGSALVSWLADQSTTELESVTKAMKVAYRTMVGIKDYEKAEFKTEIRGNGWLNISCPGDRCGLHPESSIQPSRDTAYAFVNHNVDTAVQMLTLVSGLARLHDKAKAELEG